jgi:hypothetical protein
MKICDIDARRGGGGRALDFRGLSHLLAVARESSTKHSQCSPPFDTELAGLRLDT